MNIYKNIITILIAIALSLLSIIGYANEDRNQILVQCEELIDQKKYDDAIVFIDKNIILFENEKDVSAVLEILNLKAKAYTHQYKFDDGFKIYDQIAILAKKHKKNNHYANALSSKSSILNFKSDYKEALQLSQEILTISDLDQEIISNAYTSISSIYNNRGIQDSSLYFAQKAVDIDLKLDDHSSLPFSLATLAKSYEIQGNNKKALELYLQGITYLRVGIDDFKMATFNRFIATIFIRLNNFAKAQEYIEKSIKIAEEQNIILTASYSKYTLATILQHDNKNDEAKKIFNEILLVFEEKDRKDRTVECYARLGIIALDEGQLIKAEEYIKKGEETFSKIETNILIYDLIFAQTRLFQSEQKYTEAEKSLTPFIDKNLFDNNPRLKIRYLIEMIEIKKGQGRFEEAINLINQKTELVQELNLIKQEFLITEMEAKYNKIEDAKKIEKLHDENQIKSLLVQKKNYQLNGALLFLLFAIVAGIFILKQNKKIKVMVDELKMKNEKIASALQEKEILLKEIHHRVKNNLQIVSSLLNMQSRDVEEQTAKDALNESKNRVHSMAMIHQELYQLKNIIGINSKTYIEKLSNNLLNSYKTDGGEITMINNIDNINLDVDTSIPLGLIINELITNSLKYAFPDKMNGKIELTLKQEDNYLLLTVADNGIGIETDQEQSSNTFGLKMIRIFAKKLNAEWEILKDNGTVVSLKIKNFKIA